MPKNKAGDAIQFSWIVKEIGEKQALRQLQKGEKNFDIQLTPEHELIKNSFEKGEIGRKDLPLEVSFFYVMRQKKAQAADPFAHSRLPEVLELETWRSQDAMLILAGVDPFAIVMDWSYENFMGAEIDMPRIRHATCFCDIEDLYDYPVPSDCERTPTELERLIAKAKKDNESEEILKSLERELVDSKQWHEDETSLYKAEVLRMRSNLVGILNRRWKSGDHDPEQRRSPEFFVRWAETRGFEIEWASWARDRGYLETDPPATEAPYFDADSENYPELLHIAVRAWDYARKQTGGTPKKRVSDFVADRYPHVSEGARDAIALIANWQKAGGRPKSGG